MSGSALRRRAFMGCGAVTVLVGVLVVAVVLIQHEDPTTWLDRNLESTGSSSWLSHDTPLVTADRLADAVEPRSRVVSSWGIALRYAGGTVTIVAGPREGTANVYWDAASRRAHRHYRFGRYLWRGGGPGPDPFDPDGRRAGDGTFSSLTPDADVQTRRGEDFRGGGPGDAK